MGKVININKSKNVEKNNCSDCTDCYEDMFDIAKEFVYEMILDKEICQEQKWAYLYSIKMILNDMLPDKELT